MIQPDDILDFALRTLSSEDQSEASARRAVSAAYYALLHTIAQSGAGLFSGSPEQRQRIARAYNHNDLVKAAKKIVVAAKTRGAAVPDADGNLLKLAEAFIDLHRARMSADYDLLWTLDWEEADRLIWSAFDECLRLQKTKPQPAMIDFLLDPLFPERHRIG